MMNNLRFIRFVSFIEGLCAYDDVLFVTHENLVDWTTKTS